MCLVKTTLKPGSQAFLSWRPVPMKFFSFVGRRGRSGSKANRTQLASILCIFYTITHFFVHAVSILLPFGVYLGDALLPVADDDSSDPQSKLAFSNLTCPVFGEEQDTLYVRTHQKMGNTLVG